MVRGQESGRLRMVRRWLVRQDSGREAEGAPGLSRRDPLPLRQGARMCGWRVRVVEEGGPMAKGRGWYGGGTVGRGRPPPPEERSLHTVWHFTALSFTLHSTSI